MNIDEQIAAETAKKAAETAKKAARIEAGKALAGKLGASVTDSRAESLAIAADKGAELAVLRLIADAPRLSRADTITLPEGEYCNLSRGRGWCRKSDGTFFDDYKVGPGEYSVGSTDGFRRKDRVEWRVKHIQVGEATWTIAE